MTGELETDRLTTMMTTNPPDHRQRLSYQHTHRDPRQRLSRHYYHRNLHEQRSHQTTNHYHTPPNVVPPTDGAAQISTPRQP